MKAQYNSQIITFYFKKFHINHAAYLYIFSFAVDHCHQIDAVTNSSKMSAQVKLSSSPRSAIVFRQHAIRRSASTAIRSSRQVQAVRADLAATKYNLRLACCTKSTPPDQVQQYLEVLEKASKTESLVEGALILQQ